MKVKVLKEHGNSYGSNYEKKIGDEYEHPSPTLLIDGKYVKGVVAQKTKKAATAPK